MNGIQAEPILLSPCYKEYLWGGGRLKTEFGKMDAPEITAESWELASNESGSSLPLLTGMDRRKDWGTNCTADAFPILVKLIDAKKALSVQVHPSDETARVDLGEQGKSEMWYIVDSEPKAFIYFGLSRRITRSELIRRAIDGSICEVLNKVPVSKGDVFYILPGTIHAIGAGILIAEIQQNSNTTFRLYDYGRLGTDGKPRELHLERASEVAELEPVIPMGCRANNSVRFSEFSMHEMFSCRYFRAWRLDVQKRIRLSCDGSSFHHLLCVEGQGAILVGNKRWGFRRGTSVFMPASLGEYEIWGECRILLSHV